MNGQQIDCSTKQAGKGLLTPCEFSELLPLFSKIDL